MKKDYTHIVFLIDRSGSMSGIKKDMEGGIKTFLAEQKLVPGKCTITAAQFDTEYEILHSLKDINEVEKLSIDPRGGTALIDSMVRLINEAGKELANLPEEERPERVLFITITDGEENSSRESTNEQLAKLIKEQEEKYLWQFTYLGANQDAFGVARGIGVSGTKSMNYATTTVGINKMFSKLSAASTRYRGVSADALTSDSFAYTEAEQKDI
jgi:uncharacterized protein YegL